MGLRRLALIGLLVASVAHAQTHIEDNQLHFFPGGISGEPIGLNAIQFSADPSGTFDSTSNINNCLATACPAVPTSASPWIGACVLPGGTFKITGSILIPQGSTTTLNAGCQLRGAGKGATVITSDAAGTGYSMIRSGAIVRTCTGGAGSCDVRFGRSGRGAGCYCQANSDCTSGTCATTSGVVERSPIVRDLSLIMAKDNMVGLDAGFMSEGVFENLSISTQDSLAHTNTIDVEFSDGNGAVSGYANTLTNSTLTQADVCVWVRSQANAQHIHDNALKQGNSAGCGSGIVVEASTQTQIYGNQLQTTKAPVCTGGTTCSGGYNNGGNCSVATDCKEGDIVLLGNADQVAMNYIEDSNNPHIVLGCSATPNGPCTAGVAVQQPMLVANFHTGSGAPVVRTNLSPSLLPLVLEGGALLAVNNQLAGNIVKFANSGEPLPTCATGIAGTTGSLVYDQTLSPRQLCVCNDSAKWCVLTVPNCTTGTTTACGTS